MIARLLLNPLLVIAILGGGGLCAAPGIATIPGLRGSAAIIAHRGASQELPEHTLPAYELAMEQGAHFIEPDLQLTADNVLIALHDGSLNRTTNVAERTEFEGRVRLDRKGRHYWSPRDFTWEEIQSLEIRPGKRRSMRKIESILRIPSLAQIVQAVRAYTARTGRQVGLVPEFKHRGMIDSFVDFVKAHRLDDPESGIPMMLQSFSLSDLKAVRGRVAYPSILLSGGFPDPAHWKTLEKHVDVISPNKKAVLATDAQDQIAALHAAGFHVITYTFADDCYDASRFPSAEAELRQAFDNGVDAVFTDSPATAAQVRHLWLGERGRP